MLHAIRDRLASLRIGTPISVLNLAMFPLLTEGDAVEPSYITLDEALERQMLVIDEVDESGHVPELKVVNQSAQSVLLVDGEELVGAKQNRILNLTILVAANTTTTIPVSCVESGRWSRQSARFASAKRAHYASGRRMKMDQVSHSLREHGERTSDQSQVWADIRMKSERLGSTSDTGAMAGMYEQRVAHIDEYVAALSPVDGQAGAAFAVNGKLTGVDIFDAPSTLRQLFPKLVRSYALDAVDMRDQATTTEASSADVQALLGEIGAANVERFPAVGAGEDIRMSSANLTGAALEEGGAIVHLAAFRQ